MTPYTIAPYTQTPAPWAIDWVLSGNAYWVGMASNPARIVARVNESADAKLIAAAPDLLAALRNIEATTAVGSSINSIARAAIAKATGEKA